MKDLQRMQQLKSEIAQDEERYREVERLEAELMQNIGLKGFKAASTEGRYRDEKEALTSAIREKREMLAGMETQPDLD
ncbi:hypothetical protein [Terriglobus albidus]|uniref:hypothetical protein n=1 Tax=Terriglobus albidus TaxID=1592106 RepID=UPI0021E044DC|nr:hypothetical protein [Terriglobus albidus]